MVDTFGRTTYDLVCICNSSLVYMHPLHYGATARSRGAAATAVGHEVLFFARLCCLGVDLLLDSEEAGKLMAQHLDLWIILELIQCS